jgi:hypothetical protein
MELDELGNQPRTDGTMKLRYFTIQNRVTAESVKEYARANDLSLMDAKKRLENQSSTNLQYWDGHAEQWVTVPYVTEYRE